MKVRDEVIDLIVDYISDELQKSSENLPSNSQDLDEVLRITPAPTYSGRRKIESKKSSNTNSANRLKTFELIERKNDNTVLIKNPKNAKNAIDNYDDDEESDSTETVQIGRNKLGTVFNQKIVVSPVPFAVTTRESFCTLKTTPIKYAGHLLELSTPHGEHQEFFLNPACYCFIIFKVEIISRLSTKNRVKYQMKCNFKTIIQIFCFLLVIHD